MSESRLILRAARDRGKTLLEHYLALHSLSFGSFYHPRFTTFGPLRAYNDITMRGESDPWAPREMHVMCLVLQGRLELLKDGVVVQTLHESQVVHVPPSSEHCLYTYKSDAITVHFVELYVKPTRMVSSTLGVFDPTYMDHMNTFVPVFPVDWSFPLAMDCIQLWIGVIQVGTNAAFLQTKPSRRVWIHVASEVNTTQSNELVCTVHYGADKKQVMTRAIEVDPTTIQNIGIGNTVLVHNSLQNEQITISVSGGEKNTAASLLVVVLDME